MTLASCFESGVFWKAAAEAAARPAAQAWGSREGDAALESRSKSLAPAAPERQGDTQRLQALGSCLALAKSIAAGLHLGRDTLDIERIQQLKTQLWSITQAYAHEAYGAAELEKVSVVPAGDLLRSVCRGCRKRADPKRVTIMVRGCIEVACVQPAAFAKAICELVDNAVAASQPGQTVSASVFATGDGDLLWQVRDEGVGMPQKMLVDLGQPQRPAKRGGSGVGLVVARIIVEEHSGLLHFESTPALGTTATVWLPRRRVFGHADPGPSAAL